MTLGYNRRLVVENSANLLFYRWTIASLGIKSKTCDYQALDTDDKTTKTNTGKAQLFADSVDRDFGMQSNKFNSKYLHEVNKLMLNSQKYFRLLEDPDHCRSDAADDINAQTIISFVKFLNGGKEQGPDHIQ